MVTGGTINMIWMCSRHEKAERKSLTLMQQTFLPLFFQLKPPRQNL